MSETNPNTSPAEAPDREVTRRGFLTGLSMAVGAFGLALFGVPLTGFVMGPLFEKSDKAWRNVGATEKFPIGSTTKVIYEDASPLPWSGVTARTAAWLRREDEETFVAFSVNCSHLGCPVRWLDDANLFMCPCHGGVYYRNGDVAAGPPPRPLTRYPVRVKDGQVQIETSPVPILTAERRRQGRCV